MKLWPLLFVFACKSHDQPAPAPAPPPAPAPAAKPGPENQNVALVLGCIGGENTNAFDVAKCYEDGASVDTPLVHADTPELIKRFATLDRVAFPDARQEPELVVAHGSLVVVIELMLGTQAAPLDTWHGAIASQRKHVGILVGRKIWIGASGKITNEAQYFDLDTLAGQAGVKATAQLGEPLVPTGKPAEIVIADGSRAESNLLTTAESLFNALDDTTNSNLAEWFGDHFSLIDNELPAPIDAAKLTAFFTTARTGLKARPNPVGYVIAKDVACAELAFDVTQDGAIAELGLAEPKKGTTPFWRVPTLVCARFASHKDKAGKLATVYALHRDTPAPNHFVTTGKVALKDKETGGLSIGGADGTVDLEARYANCRATTASGFVGTAKVAIQIGVDGKFVKPPTVTGVPAKLAACIDDVLAPQEFPHPDVLTGGTFTIAFDKIAAPKPFAGPLADSFADRFARKPIAERPY